MSTLSLVRNCLLLERSGGKVHSGPPIARPCVWQNELVVGAVYSAIGAPGLTLLTMRLGLHPLIRKVNLQAVHFGVARPK